MIKGSKVLCFSSKYGPTTTSGFQQLHDTAPDLSNNVLSHGNDLATMQVSKTFLLEMWGLQRFSRNKIVQAFCV